MSKEIQNLKRSNCNQDCQTCNMLNIAQRRIGNQGYSRDWNYLALGQELAKERCPEGKEMQIRLLHPARVNSNESQKLWL